MLDLLFDAPPILGGTLAQPSLGRLFEQRRQALRERAEGRARQLQALTAGRRFGIMPKGVVVAGVAVRRVGRLQCLAYEPVRLCNV